MINIEYPYKIIKLAQEYFPNEFNALAIGNKIGEGTSGVVHEYNSHVIKISIISDKVTFNSLSDKFNYLIDEKSITPFAKLINYKLFGRIPNSNLEMYYYVMEKLEPLSEDEVKVFHTILSHEFFNKTKQYTPAQLNDVLNNLSRGLDFDKDEVTFFYNQVKNHPIQHMDVHCTNIMKKQQQFKLIDFDYLEWRK